MASSNFRDSINSLGWSRRDEPVNTAPQPSGFFGTLQNLNPFQDSGYLSLPTHDAPPGAPLPAPSRREEEEGWFARKFTCTLIFVITLNTTLSVLCKCSPQCCLHTCAPGKKKRLYLASFVSKCARQSTTPLCCTFHTLLQAMALLFDFPM